MPFLPDDAHWIGEPGPDPTHGWRHTLYFRGQVRLRQPVRRGVLIAAPFQTLRVFLAGELVGTAYDEREAFPLIVDLTERLRRGENRLTAQVYCRWRPMFYAQLRVEYADGTGEDFLTDGKWEVTSKRPPDWPLAQAEAEWQPAAEIGGYSAGPGEPPWGHDFALLPREVLRARLTNHNRHLREEWAREKDAPCSTFRGRYERPEYAERFQAPLRLDPATGRLVRPEGEPLFLFFTIYNQRRDGRVVLSVPEFDFDQLERDLDLMERAHVNLYLRHLGWNWLLDENGDWARLQEPPHGTNLPPFEYGYELLDYFLDRVQSHGLYLIVEGDFYWSANHRVVPVPYLTRYHLYPEALEAQALATRKIMRYFAPRPCLIGMVIGEEELGLAEPRANPHEREAFADYLRRKYGTLENLRRHWTHGYDFSDPSQFRRVRHRAEYWEGRPEEEVLFPRYPYREGVFDGLTDWAQIALPLWPRYRAVEPPQVPLYGHKSYNNFTPDDPVWIDYYEMREEDLLLRALRRWAAIVREGFPPGAPERPPFLFYSNAQDFTSSWHFLHFFRRAEIPYEVIGTGCHDGGKDPRELEPWQTIRKTIKVVASYRPYALAKGSYAVGIASGEGMGGRDDHPEEVLNYHRSALFDELGGGCAWSQTYDWLHLAGARGGREPHLSPFLRWMAAWMPVLERARFSLPREVPLLIVRNKNLQHSNRSGQDYGNARSLANFLGQLNLEFDLVMDQDLVYRSAAPYRIDLANYRVVFLPNLALDYPDPVWKTLDAWLRDPAFAGQRALCLGRVGKRSPYLAPRAAFHPRLQSWLGRRDYTGQADLRGPQTLTFARPWGSYPAGTVLHWDFGQRAVGPTGLFPSENALLTTEEGQVVAACFTVNGNLVVACGFPLGLAYDDLWGMEPRQPTYDALTPLFEGLIEELGLPRPFRAPHHVRVYVSDEGTLILLKERFGLATDAPLEMRLPEGVRYEGCRLERLPDGFTRFRVHLPPYGGLVLQRSAA